MRECSGWQAWLHVAPLFTVVLCIADQPCTEEKMRQCSGWQAWLHVTPLFMVVLCIVDQPCTEEKRRQCSGWQGWLRATPIFRDCHCRVTTVQKADCMDIHTSIFDDYCGNGNIGKCTT